MIQLTVRAGVRWWWLGYDPANRAEVRWWGYDPAIRGRGKVVVVAIWW